MRNKYKKRPWWVNQPLNIGKLHLEFKLRVIMKTTEDSPRKTSGKQLKRTTVKLTSVKLDIIRITSLNEKFKI